MSDTFTYTTGNPRNYNNLLNYHDLFLMNPKNSDYIEGKSNKPEQMNSGCLIGLTLFFSIFIIVGILLVVWTVSEWVDYTILENSGIEVTASFIDRRISEDSEGDDNYYVTYSFVYNDMEYEREQSVSYAIYNAYEYGAPVSILIDPDAPDRSRLEESFGAPYEITFGAVFWNFITWIVSGTFLSSLWRQNRILRNGYLIKGKIIKVHSHTDSDHDFRLQIGYAFSSPESGQYVEQEETSTRNDLQKAEKEIPQIGNTVAILYLDDKSTMLL